MKSTLLDYHNKRLYKSIHSYLILSYAFEILACVQTDTASDHLEFAKKLLNTGKYNDAPPQPSHFHEAITIEPSNDQSKNYASSECAKVVETNPEAKKSSHIINEMTDEYMLNPCNAKIWFVIELCETIQATHIKLANYELFSSTPKDFTVYFSDVYPALDWKLVGQFTASDSRILQTFDLNQVGFGKFIRVELRTHYGEEHYCPISEVKVHGNSMADEYEKSQSKDESISGARPPIGKKERRHKPKTSAFKVYRSMMLTDPHICGLLRSPEDKTETKIKPEKPAPVPAQPPPTQQPQAANQTILKKSIFVDLGDKVKALEISLKVQKEECERRQNETDIRFNKFRTELSSKAYKLGLIIIAYFVYRLISDFM